MSGPGCSLHQLAPCDCKDVLSLTPCLQELDEAEAISLDDALKMQVKRYMLERWVSEPFFEATLTGCLVRLSFRKGYLACEITGIEERPPGKYRCSSGPHLAESPYKLKVV